MERMTCIYEERAGLGAVKTRILMDNLTGIQYLVVLTGSFDGGIAVTPMLGRDGEVLAAPMGQE